MNQSKAAEATMLADLQQQLPQMLEAAARELEQAESALARLLARRAAGISVRRSEVGTARMAHSRAQRDLEDLRRIEARLPALLQPEPLLKVAVARAA